MSPLDRVRWAPKPRYSLQAAAACRELAQVSPSRASIAPWGNAMRLQLEHDAELARIHGEAFRAHDPRLVLS